jgi:hypothetical protein
MYAQKYRVIVIYRVSCNRSAIGEKKLKTDRKVIFLYTLGMIVKILILTIVLPNDVY